MYIPLNENNRDSNSYIFHDFLIFNLSMSDSSKFLYNLFLYKLIFFLIANNSAWNAILYGNYVPLNEFYF